MERLTDTDNYLKSCIKCKDDDCNICSAQIDAFNKLAKYEDAEEQGLLLRLPCKVGDTVWIITQVYNGINTVWAIGSRIVDSIGGNKLNPIYMVSKEPYELRFHPSQFGKSIFLTREEAEAKLKELEGK